MSESEASPIERPAAPAAVLPLDDWIQKPGFDRRKPRPLLGGALVTFGALLWAYLVLGELVVHFELNEALAVVVVAATLGLAWYGAVRHAPAGKLSKKIAPGVLGIVLFLVAVFFAAAGFESSRWKTIEAVTVAFWFPAVFAYMLGRTLIRAPKPVRSRRQRAGSIALWVVSGLVTAVALLSAMTRM